MLCRHRLQGQSDRLHTDVKARFMPGFRIESDNEGQLIGLWEFNSKGIGGEGRQVHIVHESHDGPPLWIVADGKAVRLPPHRYDKIMGSAEADTKLLRVLGGNSPV